MERINGKENLVNKMETEAEPKCEFVCSRGILKSCDIHSNTPVSSVSFMTGYDFSGYKPGCTIYVASTAMKQFVEWIDMLPGSFILVTGDCDLTVPNDVFPDKTILTAFLENPKILKWCSQNCEPSAHSKLMQIPIGLDYHTMSGGDHACGMRATPVAQEMQLKQIAMEAEVVWERQCKAYANHQFLMTTRFAGDRHDAIAHIPPECVYYEPTKTLREYCWKTQAKHAFVVSPHGNGLDCHRTWEALCLGCIPIVKTSCLDALFVDLPVWIVSEWNEITLENMKLELKKVKVRLQNGMYRLEKLSLAYWMEQIRKRNNL